MAVLFQPPPAHYIHQQHTFSQQTQMKKVLGWRQLTALGIGCTIGAGIFVVTGVVAHSKTGPALFLSYIFSGLACLFAAFCYAEMAAMVPGAGSAYAYAHATLGELGGWIIGWDLTLEYAVAAASVAQGWSKYFNALLELMGMSVPAIVSQPPWNFHPETGAITGTGSILDLPALCITCAITFLLVRGIRDSAKFNTVMVLLKVGIVLIVILVGAFYVDPKNYSPFMPFGFAGISFFGYTAFGQTSPDGQSPVGVLAGSAIVFFAYIGFDAVTCNSEETINPQRDLPIAIIGSLLISTGLYVGVALVLVGMVPYTMISEESPISDAFGAHGLSGLEFIIALGALVGITSVLLVTLMSQPRILLAIARDGLLPPSFFATIHPTYGTPYKATILTGALVSFVSSLIPLSVLVELVSIGTLLAFTIVCISIIVLRRTQPNMPRPFLCPYVPYVPLIGAFLCIMLMLSLPGANWVRLIVWLVVGLVIYYGYGIKHGAVNRQIIQQQLQEQQQPSQQQQVHMEMSAIPIVSPSHVDVESADQSQLRDADADVDDNVPHRLIPSRSKHVKIAQSEDEADEKEQAYVHDENEEEEEVEYQSEEEDPHAHLYDHGDSSAMEDVVRTSSMTEEASPFAVTVDLVDASNLQ